MVPHISIMKISKNKLNPDSTRNDKTDIEDRIT
jgi:hypothetical protein